MRILVTGGMGFIGSNFIRHMLGKYPDYQITNLDILTYAGNPENLRDVEGNPNYKFVKGDICDTAIVNELMGDSDAVVHFAAESHVDNSIKSADEFIRTNIQGTHVLLKAAKENKNIKRFVHISTDEVYGSIENGSFRESDMLRPNSPYSASKGASDLLAMAYHATFRLPVTITRSANNFGPCQYPEKIIPLFATNLIDDKPVPLYGDGMNVRDWLYVEDNCEAISLVLHKGIAGEIYNIGAGNEIPNIELTKKILKLMGKPESLIKPVADRLGHDRRYSVDITKIKKLGWIPRQSFNDALAETINWYRNNEQWWRRLKK